MTGVERPSSGVERPSDPAAAPAEKASRSVATAEFTLSADEGTNTLIASGDGRFLAQQRFELGKFVGARIGVLS